MMERHRRRDLVLVTACEDAAVVVEHGARELAGLRLDASPFDRETVTVEAELREHRNVVRIAMVLVASVARRLDERRAGRMLEQPEIGIDVVTLDLVSGSCSSPKKVGGKSESI